MEKTLKSRLMTCMLVLVLTSAVFVFAGDVIVREGNLTVGGTTSCIEYLDVWGDISGGGYLEVSGNISGGALDVDGNISGGALDVDGDIYGEGSLYMPDVYANNLEVEYDLEVGYNANMGYLEVDGYTWFGSDVGIGGILYCGKIHGGWFDPEWVQYDRQTRLQVIESVKREVAPDKQGGAVLFFNKDTKRLETYIPDEGKFYDLQGNLLHTMPTVQVATNYKTLYYLDGLTGEVKSIQKVVHDRYVIKKGFRLDRETGHFINRASGDIVPKEMAVELQKGL